MAERREGSISDLQGSVMSRDEFNGLFDDEGQPGYFFGRQSLVVDGIESVRIIVVDNHFVSAFRQMKALSLQEGNIDKSFGLEWTQLDDNGKPFYRRLVLIKGSGKEDERVLGLTEAEKEEITRAESLIRGYMLTQTKDK